MTLLAGALAGGVWGGIAGLLKARFGANEVIATLMLNVIAALLATYAVNGPFHFPHRERRRDAAARHDGVAADDRARYAADDLGS